MVEIRVAHTAELSRAQLAAIRGLLYDVFDDMEEHDFEHALGGVHAVGYDGDNLVGHASVVQRRLLHEGRTLRTGYVEGVAVRDGYRRQGIGAALMVELERVIRAAYELGALGATDEAVPFYLGRGWHLWSGTASVISPDGLRRTPGDEEWIYVLPGSAALRVDGDLACDWRDGDVW